MINLSLTYCGGLGLVMST